VRKSVPVVAAILTVVVGCQSGPSTTAPSFAAASTPRSAVPSLARGANGSPVGASPGQSVLEAREVGGISGVIPPGRYTRRGFEPRITFEVDGPWRNVQVLESFFDIQQLVGSPDVMTVQFAKPDGIYGASDALIAATTAEGAIATIRQNDGIEVVESSESRIGGLQGLQVTVENPATTDGDRSVFQVPAGPLGISPARRLWIAFFDTPEGLLAIMIGGSVARWDDALAAAEPVLESVTVGE